MTIKGNIAVISESNNEVIDEMLVLLSVCPIDNTIKNNGISMDSIDGILLSILNTQPSTAINRITGRSVVISVVIRVETPDTSIGVVVVSVILE
ncbi:MAG: hypothetical protein QXZ63_07600 [Sulfolobales archaeon]